MIEPGARRAEEGRVSKSPDDLKQVFGPRGMAVERWTYNPPASPVPGECPACRLPLGHQAELQPNLFVIMISHPWPPCSGWPGAITEWLESHRPHQLTEFEQQVAEALTAALDWTIISPHASGQIRAALMPRVAAAIDQVVEEYNDLLDEYGGSKMIGDMQAHDAADARRALQETALAALRGES